jgi:conjugal transfer pilus assembly protein TraE
MNYDNLHKQYSQLFTQRKNLIYLVALQAVAMIILVLTIFYQALNPVVIVTPPVVDSLFKVIGNRLSDSGLVQHANYFMHLYLDITPDTINAQYAQLAQYVHNNAQVEFKKQLAEHEALVQKLSLSSRFEMENIETNVNQQTVVVTGKLVFYKGPGAQSEKAKVFLIQFANKFGKPFITKIVEIENEK